MIEKRLVTLTIQKEVEVEIEDEDYTWDKVWNGSRDDGYYSAEAMIDEEIVEERVREEVAIPDGWDEVEMKIETP